MTVTVMFDDTNSNWCSDLVANQLFVRCTLQHMTNVLAMRGHVFLNDVYDALRLPRTRVGQTHGWTLDQEGAPSLDVVMITKQESGVIQLDFREVEDILDVLP